MTTRIREENKLEYAKAYAKGFDYKGKYFGTAAYTGDVRAVRGVYKKTVDEVLGKTNRLHRKKMRITDFPWYMRPWLKRSLLPPRPFEVSEIVGPENTYCEFELRGTGVYPNNSWYWHGELSSLYRPPLFEKLFPVVPLVMDTRFTDVTHLKALSHVNGAQVDIGTTLGELLETVSFLASPLKGLVKLSKKLGVADLILHEISVNGHKYFKPGLATMTRRSRNIVRSSLKTVRDRYTRKVHHVIDDASSLWCAYRFGALPLLADIGNYLELNSEGLRTQQGPVYHGRGKFERFVETQRVVSLADGSTLGRDSVTTYTEQDTYRTDVQFLRSKFDFLGDLQAFGLHPSQWVNVAWELTQLSFIIDRFYDIGTWLAAKRPKPGTDIIGGTHSLKRKKSLELVTTRLFSPSIPSYRIKSQKWYAEPLQWQSTLYKRSIAGAVPVFPALNPTLLDLSQHVDHLSLLWQRLPRIHK